MRIIWYHRRITNRSGENQPLERNHMLHSLCRAGLFAALFGLMFVPGVAWAQKDAPKGARPRHVHDEAKLFGKEAITQANLTIDKLKKAHGKDLFIDTVDKGPADQ